MRSLPLPYCQVGVLYHGLPVIGGGGLHVWSLETDCGMVLEGYTDAVTCFEVLTDGRIVSGSCDRTVRIWNPESGVCDKVLEVTLIRSFAWPCFWTDVLSLVVQIQLEMLMEDLFWQNMQDGIYFVYGTR